MASIAIKSSSCLPLSPLGELHAAFSQDVSGSETKWQTEGQWTTAQNASEQKRQELTDAYRKAYEALSELKENSFSADESGNLTYANGNSQEQQTAAVAVACHQGPRKTCRCGRKNKYRGLSGGNNKSNSKSYKTAEYACGV